MVKHHKPETRRRLYVEAMVANGGNQRQAALTAGCKTERGADKYAERMSKNVAVQQEIESRRNQALALAQKNTGISIEEVLRELKRLALNDPRKLFDKDGNLKSMRELDDDVAACVASLEVVEEFQGRGEDREHVGYVKKVKLWDKNSALEKAMKYLGLFREDNAQKTPLLPIQINIIGVEPTRKRERVVR